MIPLPNLPSESKRIETAQLIKQKSDKYQFRKTLIFVSIAMFVLTACFVRWAFYAGFTQGYEEGKSLPYLYPPDEPVKDAQPFVDQHRRNFDEMRNR